jgi:hypothetical protein
VAAVLGAAGALSIVTPAHAAATCTLTFRPIAWPALDGRARWQLDVQVTNTGTVNSTSWGALISFPSDAVIPQYWNVRKSALSYGWLAAEWNKVIRPGDYASFGLEVDMPSWDVSPLPTGSRCLISY